MAEPNAYGTTSSGNGTANGGKYSKERLQQTQRNVDDLVDIMKVRRNINLQIRKLLMTNLPINTVADQCAKGSGSR